MTNKIPKTVNSKTIVKLFKYLTEKNKLSMRLEIRNDLGLGTYNTKLGLDVLVELGLVEVEEIGKRKFYRIKPKEKVV